MAKKPALSPFKKLTIWLFIEKQYGSTAIMERNGHSMSWHIFPIVPIRGVN